MKFCHSGSSGFYFFCFQNSFLKLILKPGRYHSILGPANNQKRFKETFQQCIVRHIIKQQRPSILEKGEDRFSAKENFDKKF